MAGALGDVDELAAAVVALARIAFGVFVGQHRAGRLEHGAADEILRRDQLEAVVLPLDARVGSPARSRDRPPPACATWRDGRAVGSHTSGLPFRVRDLIDPALMASAFERCLQPERRRFRRPGRRPTMRPPIDSTFASLCSRDSRAPCTDRCRAPRECPRTLLAAICSPCPLPPSTMPRSARPSATARADREADRRIVDRLFAVRAVVVDGVSEPLAASP